MIIIVEGIGSNVASLQFALKRIGQNSQISSDAKVIKKASGVILPGVSSAQRAMNAILRYDLQKVLQNLTQPVLGICSGMQILFKKSEEGNVEGLGIFKQVINKLKVANGDPLPHMGWNTFVPLKKDLIFEGISPKSYVYYVHSYSASIEQYTLASTTYGEQFSAVVSQDNFIGMQFHPERSGKIGEQLLMNFLKKCEKSKCNLYQQ